MRPSLEHGIAPARRNPCVSVMMPAFNAERFIRQAIESVLSQTYPNWELIIVDDGSSDRTASVVGGFNDPRIKVVHQANSGESAARNTALEHVAGEFLAFLDADDIYLPNHLEVAIEYLQAHPDCGGAYTDGYYCDEAGNLLQTLSSRRIGPYQGRVIEEVIRSSAVFGPPVCVVLWSDIIAKHNLRFDTNIMIGPDWDFFRQYAEVARFGYADHKTCLYRVHQTSITFRTESRKRVLDIAKCRVNAVRSRSFRTCSDETREYVFYDLLVNLFAGFPERQSAVTQWPEFAELPIGQRARLLRLMASNAILTSGDSNYVREWLARSRELDPKDPRGLVLWTLYALSPLVCRRLLRAKKGSRRSDSSRNSPFADLGKVPSIHANRGIS